MSERNTSSTLIRVWLLGEFQVERRKEDGTWEIVDKTKWEKSYARLLFKRLLCSSGRRAQRSTLIDDLWPDSSELVERYVNDAIYSLRKVLRPAEVVKTVGNGSGYELEDQSLLWTDVDACEALLKEAEKMGRTSVLAVPLLEQANEYLGRGDFLEGEAAWWAHARRGTMERVRYRCLLWLAEAYEQQGMVGQAEIQYGHMLEDDPTDEDVLCRLMSLLHRSGMTKQAQKCYNDVKRQVTRLGLQFSSDIDAFAENLRQEFRQSETQETYLSTILPTFLIPHIHIPSSPSNSNTQQMIKSRRQVLQDILNTACAALTLSPYTQLRSDEIERLVMVINNPSYLDTVTLADLAEITTRYWRLSANASFPFLEGVSGHIQNITQLLSVPYPTHTYRSLCSLAGETTQILGKILFDIHEYSLAWSYYSFSVKAAQEACNDSLWAVGLGRVGLLLIYLSQPQNALLLVKEAQRAKIQSVRIRSWLSVVEAEAWAHMENYSGCVKALDASKNMCSQSVLDSDVYATGFNLSRLAGYEGACFVRLQKSEQALPALEKALDLIEPTAIRRKSTLFTDIGMVHAQLGNTRLACTFAQQALVITMQTKSLSTLQRIHTLRETLGPWKETSEVKSLDEQITETLVSMKGYA